MAVVFSPVYVETIVSSRFVCPCSLLLSLLDTRALVGVVVRGAAHDAARDAYGAVRGVAVVRTDMAELRDTVCRNDRMKMVRARGWYLDELHEGCTFRDSCDRDCLSNRTGVAYGNHNDPGL